MTIKEYVANKKLALTEEIKGLEPKPSFIIMQVNEDEASNAYVRGKLKDAAEVGINCELKKYPLDISEEELIAEVKRTALIQVFMDLSFRCLYQSILMKKQSN